MKNLFIFILFLIYSPLHADSQPGKFGDVHSAETKSILTNIGSEPSTFIAGCVNVIK